MFKEKLAIKINKGIPEVIPQNLISNLKDLFIIDVRRPEEFTGELGHIEGSKLITLGNDLTQFLQNGDRNTEIVFVCRSGGRSAQATALSQELEYKNTANLVGGMILWNDLKYPIQK